MNILVVDDDEGIRETMRDILVEKNYVVNTAQDGYEAVELVKSVSYNVILMDIRMPGLDGIEASKRIKEIQPDAKIYLVSAYVSPEIYEDAKEIGIEDIFSKPVNFEQLERVLA